MKKLVIVSTSLLSSAVMAAMPVNHPVGSSFTLSNAPNIRALSTVHGNPASPFLMVNQEDDDNFRFGILGPLGVGVEMGDVSDLGDRAEEIEDILDADYSSSTPTELQAEADKANEILKGIGDTAYIKTSLSMQVPFMPLIYKTKNKGAFMIDASLSGVVRANVIADDITANTATDELETDTSFYAQTATDLKIGFGYSQAMWENSHGMLIGGVKANLHDISLGRALVSLNDDSDNADDAASDAISDDAVSSTGIGLDLGAVWVSNYYQVGVTFANINEPEFDGAPINSTCGTESCDAAANLISAGKLDASGSKYVMEMQTTIDAAVSTKGKQVTLGLSYDTNAVKDAVGDEYQWAAASVSYYGDSHFLPGLRVGYRQNMAGTELSYGTFGLTILKRLNIDLAVALETVEDEEGDELPRSAYFSISYDTAF
ncbi:conjugal transfer protein TraF [Marinomonas sp. M1K-6]|uniref:Conjugal transfer protein TraF n=1 Tax=Marinomonas profundi TaxID=2726122 RepID=A0A847RAR6_9GAMM|nr:conjugal transfer protein TraF [Marinomonas profundi]NLQ18307.1 conjugal transfer protein TraF [Marinomonas profundi]UDV02370.1 conjugal transfer protein TraF [Marinomonas profundi]